MILPAKIYGYVLFSRKWYPLSVDLITAVPAVKPGENDGFRKLALPKGHKDIVRDLVQTHTRKLDPDSSRRGNPQRQFDSVKGKGRGLIIFLHGAPGVGKTSTAECVVANAGRPLFHITCGDIGDDSAQEVEANLDRFFDLAGKWNCVLLLDEADVFLSSRQRGDIKHNSLVSVFLRVLEYYPGILILTTNRVGNFDEAIKSRVHCALYYPPLNQKQTLKVWSMNLNALKEQNEKVSEQFRIRFHSADIKSFAKRHCKYCTRDERWNGSQIKNAFQTAVALAEWRMLNDNGDDGTVTAPDLTRGDFEKVASASKHFDMYLANVRFTDEARAIDDQLRNDGFGNDIPDRDGNTTGPAKKDGRSKRSDVDEPDEEDEEEEEEDEDDTDEEEKEDSDETEQDSSESEDVPLKKKRGRGKKTSKKARGHKKVEKEEPESEASEDGDTSGDESSDEERDTGIATPPQSTKKEKKSAGRVDKKKKKGRKD